MQWNHFLDILPVLTLAIGYGGTFVTERFRDRNESRRRRTSAIEDFERTLLLDTQDALYGFSGEIQDFAFAVRGESERPYGSIVDSTWRASARLEMLATRLESDETREVIGEVLVAGQSITSGSWPDEHEWSTDDRALLDKSVDDLLECEQRAVTLLGDRLRALTYRRAAPIGVSR